MIFGLYVILWALSIGAGWLIGNATGRKYDALCLTGIAGFPRLVILAAVLAADSQAT